MQFINGNYNSIEINGSIIQDVRPLIIGTILLRVANAVATCSSILEILATQHSGQYCINTAYAIQSVVDIFDRFMIMVEEKLQLGYGEDDKWHNVLDEQLVQSKWKAVTKERIITRLEQHDRENGLATEVTRPTSRAGS